MFIIAAALDRSQAGLPTLKSLQNSNKYISEFQKYDLNTEKVVNKCLLNSH